MELQIGDTDGRGANILVGIELVTSNCHADVALFCFARAHGANESGIGDLATSRDLVGRDEIDGVVANHFVGIEMSV